MKIFEFSEEDVKRIAHALRTTIRINQQSVDEMCKTYGLTESTRETGRYILEGNVKMRKLLKYIES